MALQRWGEPRFTRDVDLTLLCPFGAEDLVILKTFAGRPRDWIDIESVLVRQWRSLDWRLIVEELQPLLELREPPDNVEKLQQLRSKVEKGA